ncbi:MAG TPA: N-acetylmuramoyl-L-alanine amidase [Bacteriovoracaceae bacterium]|nr:N-acetylmuramoyl-L-alanine amidase [Bacteriovoracaceae bacterium]
MKFLLILALFISFPSWAKVVLIDPGHGGEESGAVGHLDGKKMRKVFEKDLSLRLSKKIKEELAKKTTTYLTRSMDRFVSLQERADLADLVKADLFLSIHFNSSTNAKSNGFELYYLDNNSNAANAKVEKTENLIYKGSGEELIVNQILIDLVVQQTVSHSRALARKVHEKIKPILKTHKISDRGIKPGLFYVLALSKRPGLLVEVGFVSNPSELQKVNEDKFLTEMAKAISVGVMEFIQTK